jgi:hypothetical protein
MQKSLGPGFISLHESNDLLLAIFFPIVGRQSRQAQIHGVLEQEYAISYIMHLGTGDLDLQLHVLNNM